MSHQVQPVIKEQRALHREGRGGDKRTLYGPSIPSQCVTVTVPSMPGGVSFVSVTQQFNTTTSMGRLTLNVCQRSE